MSKSAGSGPVNAFTAAAASAGLAAHTNTCYVLPGQPWNEVMHENVWRLRRFSSSNRRGRSRWRLGWGKKPRCVHWAEKMLKSSASKRHRGDSVQPVWPMLLLWGWMWTWRKSEKRSKQVRPHLFIRGACVFFRGACVCVVEFSWDGEVNRKGRRLMEERQQEMKWGE